MSAADRLSEGDVASLTLRMLPDIKRELADIREILLRHETRFGRVERGVNEVKSDITLIENRLLSRMNESIEIQLRLEDIVARLPAAGDDPRN